MGHRSCSLIISCFLVSTLAAFHASAADTAGGASSHVKILFLGDNGHHSPPRFGQLQPVIKERGIDLTYTDKLTDLNAETLGQYDGLMIYANTTKISPEQEKALLDYVAAARASSRCTARRTASSTRRSTSRSSARSSRATAPAPSARHRRRRAPDHEGLRAGFESWDETYVHTKHNDKDRTVLEYRVGQASAKEPWTWVRTHGKGRVFYTAWGHDQRTWGNPGFQNLVERGIRWASGRPASAGAGMPTVEIIAEDDDAAPPTSSRFEYVDAEGSRSTTRRPRPAATAASARTRCRSRCRPTSR